MINFEERNTCRFCDTKLKGTVLDLGELYPSNFVVEGSEESSKVPLTLTECPHCGLVQMKHTIDREDLYRQYWYRSGLNDSMKRALQDIVHYVLVTFGVGLDEELCWLDIGCNDGTLLDIVPDNFIKVGFDPARNLATEAEESCDYFVNDFFSSDSLSQLYMPEPTKADVITAIAMFYDLEDINGFVQTVRNVLAENGVFIVQFTDLTTTLRINAIDNMCHEHLEYYYLQTIDMIADSHGLEIIDVTYNNINGGSVRVAMAHKDERSISSNVELAMEAEESYLGHDDIGQLSIRIQDIKERVVNFIHDELKKGSSFAIFGASTKGNTLLQYFGINSTHIDHAAEVNSEKYGLKTVGTGIPIIPQEESLESNPDFYLVLPWHFIDGFIHNHQDYLENGGVFFVPLPEPKLYFIKDGVQYEQPI